MTLVRLLKMNELSLFSNSNYIKKGQKRTLQSKLLFVYFIPLGEVIIVLVDSLFVKFEEWKLFGLHISFQLIYLHFTGLVKSEYSAVRVFLKPHFIGKLVCLIVSKDTLFTMVGLLYYKEFHLEQMV